MLYEVITDRVDAAPDRRHHEREDELSGAQLAVLAERRLQLGEPVEHHEQPSGSRITSYNVCYTKLLRSGS